MMLNIFLAKCVNRKDTQKCHAQYLFGIYVEFYTFYTLKLHQILSNFKKSFSLPNLGENAY